MALFSFAIISTTFMEVYKMKTYEAYVSVGLVDYFCDQVRLHGGKVKSTRMTFTPRGDIIHHMIVEAEEGLIDPKWEVKD